MLVLGYGLLPGTEIARMLGCQIEMVPELNGVVPWRGPNLETSVKGVLAVGDGFGEVRFAVADGADVDPAALGERGADEHGDGVAGCGVGGGEVVGGAVVVESAVEHGHPFTEPAVSPWTM